MHAGDLKAKAIGAFRRLQKLPGIVRGLLRDPKLAYILELRKQAAREVYKLIALGARTPGEGEDELHLWRGSEATSG
jgi:hypothetical protein